MKHFKWHLCPLWVSPVVWQAGYRTLSDGGRMWVTEGGYLFIWADGTIQWIKQDFYE